RDGEEKTKAARIIERVKSLSTPYFLSGENFRNN
ncbi:TPA: primosomal protein DnaI, partial [Staphylococcus aureus]